METKSWKFPDEPMYQDMPPGPWDDEPYGL
jgi:hypothetical protein